MSPHFTVSAFDETAPHASNWYHCRLCGLDGNESPRRPGIFGLGDRGSSRWPAKPENNHFDGAGKALRVAEMFDRISAQGELEVESISVLRSWAEDRPLD